METQDFAIIAVKKTRSSLFRFVPLAENQIRKRKSLALLATQIFEKQQAFTSFTDLVFVFVSLTTTERTECSRLAEFSFSFVWTIRI